jgi:hypothetical protein
MLGSCGIHRECSKRAVLLQSRIGILMKHVVGIESAQTLSTENDLKSTRISKHLSI